MSKLTLFVVSGKIDRVGRLHGRSKFSSELVWRSWARACDDALTTRGVSCII